MEKYIEDFLKVIYGEEHFDLALSSFNEEHIIRTATSMIKELETKLLKVEAQVEELREALQYYANKGDVIYYLAWDGKQTVEKPIINKAQQALSSTGTDHLKKQLEDVKEILIFLQKVSAWPLGDIERLKANKFVEELKAKRNKLTEALK